MTKTEQDIVHAIRAYQADQHTKATRRCHEIAKRGRFATYNDDTNAAGVKLSRALSCAACGTYFKHNEHPQAYNASCIRAREDAKI